MKRNFIVGMALAPILLLAFWGLKTLMTPSVTVSEAEQKEILEDINYTTEKAKDILPVFSFHFGYKGQVKEAKLSDFKGKPTIVHVWATWCAPCLKELPEFDVFASKYKGKFNILAISVDITETRDEAVKTVSSFWKDKGYTDIPIVFDHKAQLSRALGLAGVPTTIFFNAEGKEIGRVNGVLFWTDPKIKHIIQNILA